MSNSNVVYIQTRFESKKQLTLANRYGFASFRETFELLKAFSLIESPVFRRMIIQTAREAASCSQASHLVKISAAARRPSGTLVDQ